MNHNKFFKAVVDTTDTNQPSYSGDYTDYYYYSGDYSSGYYYPDDYYATSKKRSGKLIFKTIMINLL